MGTAFSNIYSTKLLKCNEFQSANYEGNNNNNNNNNNNVTQRPRRSGVVIVTEELQPMPRPIYSTSALLSSISPARLSCVSYFHADPHHLIWVAGAISMLIDKSRLNYRRKSVF